VKPRNFSACASREIFLVQFNRLVNPGRNRGTFMSQDHRLQQQRFELKYLIKESLTPWMRDFISSYLELDDYGVGRPALAYPVHSLYLDSDDLFTHHEFINSAKNRFKLRLRYYDDQPDSPVFFEIKARVDNCIKKSRCGVRRAVVAQLLAGQMPPANQFFSTEPRHRVALENFLVLMQSINARPKAHNAYEREAWVSPHDNSVRVTFDRHIRIEPHFRDDCVTAMRQPVTVYSPMVVFELKFTDRFPNWFNELVQRFNLMQGASAKYCGGVLQLGEERFNTQSAFELSPFPPERRAGPVAADLIATED
jgi:hypothetical protein